MQETTDGTKKKAVYVTPQLRVIELVTEEVLGSNCKNDSYSLPDASPCTAIPTPCSGDGS